MIRINKSKLPAMRGSAVTLAQAILSFLTYQQAVCNLAPSTIRAYGTDLRQFSNFLQEGGHSTKVRDIDADLIGGFIASLGENMATTRNRKLMSISSFFKWAQGKKLIGSNPASEVPRPKKPQTISRYFTTEELGHLLAAAGTPLLRAIFTLLAYTGMRRGEMLAANLSSINWENPAITVMGKGQKERMIELHPMVVKALKEYLLVRPCIESDRLFITEAGTPIYPSFVQREFKACMRRAGLQNRPYVLHTLRHTFCTILASRGIGMGTIQALAGHSDIGTTARYVHAMDEIKRAAIEQLPML